MLSLGVPSVPQSLVQDTSTQCSDDAGNQVVLEWEQPLETGGVGIEIERYLLTVKATSGPEFSCPPDQCNVTTTNTTISGLSCNTNYTATVRAVNCNGMSNETEAINISIGAPGQLRALTIIF